MPQSVESSYCQGAKLVPPAKPWKPETQSCRNRARESQVTGNYCSSRNNIEVRDLDEHRHGDMLRQFRIGVNNSIPPFGRPSCTRCASRLRTSPGPNARFNNSFDTFATCDASDTVATILIRQPLPGDGTERSTLPFPHAFVLCVRRDYVIWPSCRTK